MEMFMKVLKDGSLKKMLKRDPNVEGSKCEGGICSLTVDDFLKTT